MRTFIAIELPKGTKDALVNLQERLKSSQADVKWVKPQNIHLTLKFLGEIDERDLIKINEIIDKVAVSKPAFKAQISLIGAFPEIDSPRIVWAGLGPGDKETKEIAFELENRLAEAGIPKEDRPFSSHITIGRTRSGLNREKLVMNLKSMENKIGGDIMQFSVTKVTLFKSTLTPAGPVYEALKEANLKTT